MKKIACILVVFLFISYNLSSQILLRTKGRTSPSVEGSFPIEFSLAEDRILQIRLEHPGYSSVLSFYTEGEKGFEWDGSDEEGNLFYSDLFQGPKNYEIFVKGFAEDTYAPSEFTLTIEKITPFPIRLNVPVKENCMDVGLDQSVVQVWYEIYFPSKGDYGIKMFSPSQELSVILKKDGFVESFVTPYRGGESYTEFLVPERGYYFVEVIFHKRIDEKFSFMFLTLE